MTTTKKKRLTLVARATALGMGTLAAYALYRDSFGVVRHGGYVGEWNGWKIRPTHGLDKGVLVTRPDGYSLTGKYREGRLLWHLPSKGLEGSRFLPRDEMKIPEEVEILALDIVRRYVQS